MKTATILSVFHKIMRKNFPLLHLFWSKAVRQGLRIVKYCHAALTPKTSMYLKQLKQPSLTQVWSAAVKCSAHFCSLNDIFLYFLFIYLFLLVYLIDNKFFNNFIITLLQQNKQKWNIPTIHITINNKRTINEWKYEKRTNEQKKTKIRKKQTNKNELTNN